MISKKLMVFFLLYFIAFCFHSCAVENQSEQRETLTQVSTFDALASGIYDGLMTLQEVQQYGDTGIGTFQGLDGEMLMMDGIIYKIAADGSVSTPAPGTLTPYMAVTFFDVDLNIPLKTGQTLSTFGEVIDPQLPSVNLFYVFRIEGSFQKIKTRSVPKQEKPYRPLAEVVKTQSVFEFGNVEGIIVGLRCPPFIKGINVPGYHLHFLSQDRKSGGHVLDFMVDKATLKIDNTPKFALIIPESPDFYQHNFAEENIDLKQIMQPK